MASTFIRATEVWVPTPDGWSIDLAAGLYCEEVAHFQAISRGLRFAYGEGLVGKAWERGQPIILKNLDNPLFNRREAALHDGLTCAVALPIFEGRVLRSVLMLLCNDDLRRDGAIELWCAPEGETEMFLIDGYFGASHHFEEVTRRAAFPRGVGLAGGVWETGLPLLLPELARAGQFARHDAADRDGFHRGVGWPCAVRGGGAWAMAFLSAQRSPIAGRFESWVADDGDGSFWLDCGFCESGTNLGAQWPQAMSVPAFSEVRATLVPMVTDQLPAQLGPLGDAAIAAGLTSAVALPILSEGRFRAILAWYF